MIKTFKQRESQVLMSSSLGNNLVRWLRENSNEPDEETKKKREREREREKKLSPQRTLKSKRFVVAMSRRQFEDLTHTNRLGYQTAL